MKAILAGRNASLNIAQMKVRDKNNIKSVMKEYRKRKEPVANNDIFICRIVPILSLNFPEKGAEIKAPTPYTARTSPASLLDTLRTWFA
jgi:hypothetical protein